MEKKIWSNQETKKFIALYKENPILWNKNSANYRNIAKKRKIQNHLSVQFNTTVAEIGRKIIILRTQWQKEYKKMQNPAKHYESRWKWFKSLKPIFDLEQGIEDETDVIDDSTIGYQRVEDENNTIDDSTHGYQRIEDEDDPIDNGSHGYLTDEKEPGATYLQIEEDRDLSFMEDEDCKNSNNDEYQIFGNYIAIKLRSMHHEKNIRELMRLIQEHVDLLTEEDEKEFYSKKIHL